ncbi:hypothetical protein IKG31_03155 [Candidatus Saccharibacteria bacterium]|nr:hypothetical protein [Candidatus Saccharibacteria bacterium]
MNKETIYIEPSDDITDILSRIKASDKKVIALVPPKKPAVLLSSVNIKLISRVAKSDKKAIVLVTTDDSLTKLAMAANLPVAPSLKSRPVMPGEEDVSAPKAEDKEPDDSADPDDEDELDESNEFEDDEPGAEDAEEETGSAGETDNDDEEADGEEEEEDEGDDEEEDEEETEEDDNENEEMEKDAGKKSKKSSKSGAATVEEKVNKKSEKKAKKSDKEHGKAKNFFSRRKFWIIGGAAIAVCVALFLVWAFTIAPRVSVSVSVRTSNSNFSENVTFTKNSADENSSIGSFYIHEEKIEKEQAVKFTATGKKDLGEIASGELVLYAYFIGPGSVKVAAGSTFSHGTLNYITLTDVTLAGPADTKAKTFNATCNNYTDDFQIGVDDCEVSATVSIKAAAPGEDYNLSATSDGWTSSVGNITAANLSDITGGTSRIVTVVQQSDVDLALDKLKSEGSAGSKEELYGKLSNTVMPIEASFKVSTSEPQTAPGVGQEVEEGVTPEVSTKTVYSVYTIDRVRMEEFIKTKATLDEGKRLYSYGEPFVEYFAEADKDTYTAKLKTTYKVGPEISETEVLDKIRGEKIGRIEPILKDAFPGVANVTSEKSYFWVNSIPSDENKVEIKLTIEGEDENK